jgi:hypothetical protein
MKKLTKSILNSLYLSGTALYDARVDHLLNLKPTTKEEELYVSLGSEFVTGGKLHNVAKGNIFLEAVMLTNYTQKDHIAGFTVGYTDICRTTSIVDFIKELARTEDERKQRLTTKQLQFLSDLKVCMEKKLSSSAICEFLKINSMFIPDMDLVLSGTKAQSEFLRSLKIIK